MVIKSFEVTFNVSKALIETSLINFLFKKEIQKILANRKDDKRINTDNIDCNGLSKSSLIFLKNVLQNCFNNSSRGLTTTTTTNDSTHI